MRWIDSGDPTAVSDLGFGDDLECSPSFISLLCSLPLSILVFIFHFSFPRAVCAECCRCASVQFSGAELLCMEVSTMQVVYFKTDESGPTGFLWADGRIDFSDLGEEFELIPTTIAVNGIQVSKTGLKSESTFAEIHSLLAKGIHVGTEEHPMIVNGKPSFHGASTGGEGSRKRLKTPGIGFSESVDKAMKDWKSKYSKFLEKSKEEGCELSTENGVPLDYCGRPSILLDRLTAGWTKDVRQLWERVDDASDGVVPVVGVSGSGKTRFLYELLAENWGFFWTARTKGNGGSEDVSFVTDHVRVEDKATNHTNVVELMRCAILARLLILEIFLEEIPALTPLQWLMLQVQFRVFSRDAPRDAYHALTVALAKVVTDLKDSDVPISLMIDDLWTTLQRRIGCQFIVVLDEAQVLGGMGVDCYESPESRKRSSIFSPLVKALQKPSLYATTGKVFVAGTGVSLLKLEEHIGSVIGKESAKGAVRFASASFSSWEDEGQVLEFCHSYLKLEVGQEEENARYLLRKFRGRRRCLVSCVEQLLTLNKGVWSEKVVDDYFKEITSSDDITSIYHAVEALCESKGNFVLNGKTYAADALVRKLGLFLAFEPEGEYLVTTKEDMALLEVGLGQLKLSSASNYIFSIYEPTVHWSILNYLSDTDLLQSLLKEQMVSCMSDASAMGRLWEKLFTFYVAGLFDGTKLLTDMCCFKGAKLATLPQNFAIEKPRITGEVTGVWRESYKNKTVSAFLDAEEKSRPPCLIFNDRSGPDVLFVVRLGDLKIPVFCQLKLRSRMDWVSAEATTNPSNMYKYREHATFKKRVLEACKDGCISLVVGYPAKKPAKFQSITLGSRLCGYVGQTEAETLFGPQLCDFLSSLGDIRKRSS